MSTLKEQIWEVIKQSQTNRPDELSKIADDYAISFHNWMRKNDTPENAEKFFHYTDEDMLNVFKEENRL